MGRGLDRAPLPTSERMVSKEPEPGDVRAKPGGLLTDSWIDYMQRLVDQLNACPFITNSVGLSTQAASIGATDFSGGGVNTGTYRITYLAEITRAATVSSSLTVTFDWTSPEGVSKSASGVAITGNTTTTIQSGTVMIRVASGTPIRYSTVYASVGATTMLYQLSVSLERLVA